MGLLDNMMQPQTLPPMQGGLLGGLGASRSQPVGGGAGAASPQGLQMAQQLSQNPTPQMAQQIIQQLHQMGNPEAQQFEQMLTQVMGDPQQLKQLADAVVQKLSGGGQ